jgi:hypothetical protein
MTGFRNGKTYFMAFRKQAQKAMEEQVLDQLRVLTLAGLQGVTDLTPVDTGRLRGAWDVETGNERVAETAVAIRTGSQAVAEGFAKVAQMDRPENVRIVNNVTYGVHVNDGTPRVAPVLMVERTAERLRQTARRRR